MSTAFPDVFSACISFISIPAITVAKAECSFSKIKFIKNDFRNSTSQNRLSNIGILNIERERTKEIHIQKVIDNFNLKARQQNFSKELTNIKLKDENLNYNRIIAINLF